MVTPKIEKVWIADGAVWIRTTDGQEACERVEDYPRLAAATPAQLLDCETDRYGIHWAALDEDLCFEGFFKSKNNNPLYRLFIAHPELNASAVARRMGMSQSLFAGYVSETRKPSAERMNEIMQTVRDMGQSLLQVK